MTMIFRTAMIALWGLLAPLAAQADRLVVLELFTSQGCDRCPPMDALIGDLAQRDDVLPLALHVDYWDYLGWQDQFALAYHGERQARYAHLTDRRRLFTPLLMVGGLDPVEGYTPMKLVDLLEKHRRVDVGVSLEVTVQDGQIVLTGLADAAFPAPAQVVLVTYRPESVVQINHGQNAGHTLTYSNVVLDWQSMGTWDGTGALRLDITPPQTDRGAVLVQAANQGLILAATRLP